MDMKDPAGVGAPLTKLVEVCDAGKSLEPLGSSNCSVI